MATMQIQIKGVYVAKEGKKFGSLLAEDGTRFALPKKIPTSHVQKGMQAVVEYHQEDWSDGAVHIVDSIRSAEFRADPVNGTPAYNPQAAESAKSRHIFIQGIAQAVITSHPSAMNEMSIDALVMSAVEAARDAYEAIMLQKPKPAPQPAQRAPEPQQYTRDPNDDPRFAAPPPTPDSYGAQR